MSSRVLITGAGARIGSHFARGLAANGWQIAIHYNRSKSGAQALADEIKAHGGQAEIVQANLNVPDQLDSLVARSALALGGPLTALINNASTFSQDVASDFTRDSFDHHMNINAYATVKLAQDFASQADHGCIINMIDQRLNSPHPDFFTYTLSKSMLAWATKTMAQSFAPHIRVNAVSPGPSLPNIHDGEEGFAEEEKSTLLGRGSPPETLLHAVEYLLSAQSVTGQIITVDGGQHLNVK